MFGDLKLKSKKIYNFFINNFNLELIKVLVNQVPHHGASKNWNTKLLNDTSAIIYVCNYGLKNIYNHPNYQVFSNIVNSRNIFLPNTENLILNYQFCFF